MRLQPITYRGRLVACATATMCFLADGLRRRPVGDPDRTFVIFMCAYATDVLRGELPGPYTDGGACRYARAALVPAELGDPQRRRQVRRHLRSTARALGLPAAELELALDEAARGRRGVA